MSKSIVKPVSNLAGEASITVSSEIAGYEGVKAVDRIIRHIRDIRYI